MNLPSGMTAEYLREIASLIDQYDELAEKYLQLIEAVRSGLNTSKVEAILATIRPTEIQVTLRRWADEIDWLHER